MEEINPIKDVNNGIVEPTFEEDIFSNEKSIDNTQTPHKAISPSKKGKRRNSPKVSVSLSSNLSSSVVPCSQLQEMFSTSDIAEHYQNGNVVKMDFARDVLSIDGQITKEIQGFNRKPVSLTTQEQKLCYALSYLLTIEEESPELKFAIDETEAGSSDPLFVPMMINASTLSKVMTGETRTRYKNTVGELLKSISTKVQVFKCPYKRRSKKEEEVRTLLFSFPLINCKQIIEDKGTDKDGNETITFLGMKAELLRPFFNNIRSQNTPLHPSIFPLWIDSNLFANLFSKLNELYYFAMVGFDNAKKEVLSKYGNKINATKVPEIEEEIQQLKRKCITRTLDFETIMNLCEDDYGSTRKRRYKFKKELEKCIERYIEYGIISSGKILEDKNQVVFTFNMNFREGSSGRVIEIKK